MTFQILFETALAQKIMTPDMEAALESMLWSYKFTWQEMNFLEILTQKLEAGEIKQISA
ncbi:MAG: hypothetical protein WBB82_04805 [Limnothrix sp.]